MNKFYILTLCLFSYAVIHASSSSNEQLTLPRSASHESIETIISSRASSMQSVVTIEPHIPVVQNHNARILVGRMPSICSIICEILGQTAATFAEDCCPNPQNYGGDRDAIECPVCIRLCVDHPRQNRDVQICRECCQVATGSACIIGMTVTCAVIIP